MDRFLNESTAGNEKAIRRGVRVPEGDVNLSWVKAPALNPENNLIIIDTSNITPENTNGTLNACKLMYADELGILQDEFGNQVIFDEYPAVADVFSINEDFELRPGNEYTVDSILPFVHISRYFHIDIKGYSSFDTVHQLSIANVKVVDNNGKEYIDSTGKPRYRVAVARAVEEEGGAQTAYRIYVYIDSDKVENLYLKYNKIEIDTNGEFKNQNINHREILNPLPYYKYVPEETDVFDPVNRFNRIYSTKPTNQKEQILGIKTSAADGYKVFVPKKAVNDPRLFQLFRWRVTCDFTEKVKVDPTRTKQAIRCGTVSTNWTNPNWTAGTRAIAPYVFYNLSVSDYNAGNLQFINPVTEKLNKANPSGAIEKTDARYWNVNFDTVTLSQLQEFDVLVWHPETYEFDFTPYLNKIDYFTRQLGGTLIIECGTRALPQGLGCTFTSFVDPYDGTIVNYAGASSDYAVLRTLAPADTTDIFFDADTQLGGWDFNDGSGDEYNSLHPAIVNVMSVWSSDGDTASHYIYTKPTYYETILQAKNAADTVDKPVMIRREFTSGGSVIIDTVDIATNYLAHPTTGQLVSLNLGDQAYDAGTPEDYAEMASAWAQEGAYKLLYNICLYAMKGRALDDSDEFTLSSSWSFSSPWHPSWVINNNTSDGANDILSRSEIERNQFVERTKSRSDPTVVWQRRLEVPGENGKTIAKTVKQLIEESMSEEDLRKVSNSDRVYSIEVTNSSVEHVDSDEVDENEPPYVWTEEYTPKFTVPREIGPHVIRERLTPGNYVNGQYVTRTYPPKPYGMRVDVKYADTAQDLDTKTVTWTATGTAVETINIVDKRTVTWASDGSGTTFTSYMPFDFGVKHPYGMDSYAAANYYNTHSNHNYPSYGAFFRLTRGDWGKVVYWMQTALNYFIFWGYMGGPYIPTDGYWGSATHDAVLRFQSTFGALEQDGALDAEMLSMMGSQILRLQSDYYGAFGSYIEDWVYPDAIPDNALASPNTTFFQSPLFQMSRSGISDGNSTFTWSKRSNYGGSNTPNYIWDIVQISLNSPSKIWGVTLIPHVERASGSLGGSMLFEALSVHNSASMPTYNGLIGTALANFPVGQVNVPVNARVVHGEPFFVPFNPVYGDTVMVRIGQDTPTGIGRILQFGVSDIQIHTDQSFYSQTTINLERTGSAVVTTGRDVVIALTPNYTGSGTLSNVDWSSVTTDLPSDIVASISHSGILTLRNLRVHNQSSSNYVSGPYLGRTTSNPVVSTTPTAEGFRVSGYTYYSKDEHGRRNPAKESGWITKVDGLKLFCDADGKPFGFPAMPTAVGPREAQRHYATISLSSLDVDPEVMVGFYDIKTQEFILSQEGKPEMTYLEWISRGPENVFVAAITDYEVDKKADLPADGGPLLPYRLAMPVYGICTSPGSQIKVEPLSENLGPHDMWGLPIKAGSFVRPVAVPTLTDLPTTNSWLKDYAGSVVKAFYGVPEAKSGSWSIIYGRPFVDVKDETPVVVTDTKIKVRHAPIHMVQVPTVVSSYGNAADPRRPIFTIYTRASINDSWVALTWEDIADYNVSTGEIELVDTLSSTDPTLIKVDYTTARVNYFLTHANGEQLNLNPYPGHSRDLVGKPIYVYVLPQFVKDEENRIIADSVRTTTLGWTLDPAIFNRLDPDYNPLAVQLAVVYITSTLDINDLIMLDTRRRGGGAGDTATLQELEQLISESNAYWDITNATGMTYQKGGFVLIRLPAELKDQFPNKQDIMETIRRNITVGVQFKIEDLEGKEW